MRGVRLAGLIAASAPFLIFNALARPVSKLGGFFSALSVLASGRGTPVGQPAQRQINPPISAERSTRCIGVTFTWI